MARMAAPQLIIKAHEADPSSYPKYSNLGAVVAGAAGAGCAATGAGNKGRTVVSQ